MDRKSALACGLVTNFDEAGAKALVATREEARKRTASLRFIMMIVLEYWWWWWWFGVTEGIKR